MDTNPIIVINESEKETEVNCSTLSSDNVIPRSQFVTKVYLWIFLFITITMLHVCLVVYCMPLLNFVHQHFYELFWFGFYGYVVTALIVGGIMAVTSNFIPVLVIITVEALSILCTTISIQYSCSIIWRAANTSGILINLVSLIGKYMMIDLTNWSFAIGTLGIQFCVFITFANVLFDEIPPRSVECICIIVLVIYLLYLTQLIMGDRTVQFETKDIMGAATYHYIICVFLYLICLLFFDYTATCE